MACESFIIDSDHWRHFFLILGMIWGMSAANIRRHRQRAVGAAAYPAAS